MNWFQRISNIVRLPRELNSRHIPENRPNPNTPISFFEHDGNNLYIIEGISSDSHANLNFPYNPSQTSLVSGRINRITNRGSFYTDPDAIKVDTLNKILGDLYAEYGQVNLRGEYFGEMFTIPNLIENIEHYTRNNR